MGIHDSEGHCSLSICIFISLIYYAVLSFYLVICSLYLFYLHCTIVDTMSLVISCLKYLYTPVNYTSTSFLKGIREQQMFFFVSQYKELWNEISTGYDKREYNTLVGVRDWSLNNVLRTCSRDNDKLRHQSPLVNEDLNK